MSASPRVPRIPVGIGPPMVMPITCIAMPTTNGGFDLTTVTAMAYRVWDSNGLERTSPGSLWPGVIDSGGIPTSLPTHYSFLGTEFTVNDVGTWRIAPVGTVPGGFIPCEAVEFQVVRIPGGP